MASVAVGSKQQDGINAQNGAFEKSMAPDDVELQAIHEQIENARQLTEIQAVIERLKGWVAAHPQDREFTYPVFEQLYRREEGANEALAEAETMGLSATEQAQRERLSLLRLSVHAEDAPEVFHFALGQARQALAQWKSVHPDDPLVALLTEHLEMEAEIASQLHLCSLHGD